MVWFKVDDSLAGHPKARRSGLSSVGLWVLSGSWSAQQLTDGRIPEWYVETWPRGRQAAARLVAAGLWHTPGHTCTATRAEGETTVPTCPDITSGWVFHDWQQANPSRVEVIAKREADAARKAAGRRSSARTPTVTPNGVHPAVREESRRPDPTRPGVPTGHIPRAGARDRSTTNDRVQQALDLAAQFDAEDQAALPPGDPA